MCRVIWTLHKLFQSKKKSLSLFFTDSAHRSAVRLFRHITDRCIIPPQLHPISVSINFKHLHSAEQHMATNTANLEFLWFDDPKSVQLDQPGVQKHDGQSDQWLHQCRLSPTLASGHRCDSQCNWLQSIGQVEYVLHEHSKILRESLGHRRQHNDQHWICNESDEQLSDSQ